MNEPVIDRHKSGKTMQSMNRQLEYHRAACYGVATRATK